MLFTIAASIDPIKIVLIILGLLILLIPAIILGAIALIIRSRDKAQKKKYYEQAQSYGPNPGSDADFERWKQERQNGGSEK